MPGLPLQGWAPLHSAVSSGHEAVAALLISLGADLNVRNSGGRTPLHYAVRGENQLQWNGP